MITFFFLSNHRDGFGFLYSALQLYERISGLRINMAKSGIAGVNVDSVALANLSNLAGCGIKELPMTFLGIPLAICRQSSSKSFVGSNCGTNFQTLR